MAVDMEGVMAEELQALPLALVVDTAVDIVRNKKARSDAGFFVSD